MSDATATLTDISNAIEITVAEIRFRQTLSTAPIYSAPVTSGKSYRLDLANEGADGLRLDLTATITFP